MGLEDRFAASDAVTEDTIPAHQFSYLMREYIRGKVTAGEALAAINSWLETPLTSAEQSDLNVLRGLIDAEGPQILGMLAKAIEIGDVLGLMEMDTPDYQTRAEVKAKLGF
jgi:hypothetical protein